MEDVGRVLSLGEKVSFVVQKLKTHVQQVGEK